MKKVMLLGRTSFDLEEWRKQIGLPADVDLAAGTSVAEVRREFERGAPDVVISGAGLPIETRLEMVRLVFELSTSTTMHLKDFDSGKEGMVAFVKGVLSGLAPPS